ncbi:MAG: hypothetical protein WBR17_33755 [Paraburkholderia sp.]|uniref:hypothetical protein n=1 Tax=Paraburkholderia sp. TaxID=1926495 RepID=UPI003C680843
MSLPLPLRKNGVIKAKDAELEGAQTFCEHFAIGSTCLVFIGLVIEVVVAIEHPSFDSCLERWGSVIADVLVAFGVLGELLPSMLVRRYNTEVKRRSDDGLAKANERAASAYARAAEAELKLIEFRTPRRQILAGHESEIIATLRAFAGTQFDSGLGANSGEQADFWWDLEPLLVQAGWVHLPWTGTAQLIRQGDRPLSGSVAAKDIEIHLLPDEGDALLPAAEALVASLVSVGIAAAIVGFNTFATNKNAIHISIGTKA